MACYLQPNLKHSRGRMSFAKAAFALTSFVACFGWSTLVNGATTFLNHFDVGNPINNGAGTAEYAVGNPNQLILPPSGPGGNVVSGGKFGNALSRPSGRVEYAVASNFNPFKGTVEMWIKGPGIADLNFRALWGTDTSSGAGDIRFYIYNDQVNDNLRSLGAYQNGAGGAHWEIERPIPVELLENENWHHVAWAYDTTSGSEKTALWWDGILLGNTADDGSTINPRTSFSATRMHIGEAQAGSALWPGMIDEFRISDDVVYDVQSDFTPQTLPFTSPTPVQQGDYDNDGDVDGHDLLRWQRELGSAVAPPGTDPDGSGNGIVDAADLTVWRNNFGLGASTAAVVSVPEPSCLVLAGGVLSMLLPLIQRRRERR